MCKHSTSLKPEIFGALFIPWNVLSGDSLGDAAITAIFVPFKNETYQCTQWRCLFARCFFLQTCKVSTASTLPNFVRKQATSWKITSFGTMFNAGNNINPSMPWLMLYLPHILFFPKINTCQCCQWSCLFLRCFFFRISNLPTTSSLPKFMWKQAQSWKTARHWCNFYSLKSFKTLQGLQKPINHLARRFFSDNSWTAEGASTSKTLQERFTRDLSGFSDSQHTVLIAWRNPCLRKWHSWHRCRSLFSLQWHSFVANRNLSVRHKCVMHFDRAGKDLHD